ncbi:hypothetical protein [Halotalea alkalilenta]|uniref:Uncharacterized protein n=1 Tax=Halotalea alkalilenta TaxID=376489 RepID=A0A172YB52_9GAMM|nr:hypothetical protein [Halotalea alkalilenta]ANF56448.1 hypothetical protein A5892_02345 [Halotalea alkalilenta]
MRWPRDTIDRDLHNEIDSHKGVWDSRIGFGRRPTIRVADAFNACVAHGAPRDASARFDLGSEYGDVVPLGGTFECIESLG